MLNPRRMIGWSGVFLSQKKQVRSWIPYLAEIGWVRAGVRTVTLLGIIAKNPTRNGELRKPLAARPPKRKKAAKTGAG
jgi:hypothetical protein